MFLADTTKTDFLHVLVRTHLLVLTCHHSCMLLGLGRCSNLVKNMLTRFFEWPTLEIFCLKTSPLLRNSSLAERKRPGREGVLWTCVEKISPANHIDCISLVYGNIIHCGTGLRTTVTLILSHLKWLSRLTWGENVLKFHRYKYCTTKWVTHFVQRWCMYRLLDWG